MSTIINEKFQAQNGFESPNFTVDNTGKITAPTIDVQSILLNGLNSFNMCRQKMMAEMIQAQRYQTALKV